MDQVWYLIKKFIVAIVILLIGVFVTIDSMKEEVVWLSEDNDAVLSQTPWYMISGLLLLLAGILMILYIGEVLRKVPVLVIVLITLPGICAAYYFSVQSIQQDLDYANEKAERYKETKQRLKDLRDAQLEYKLKYKNYAPTMNELITFIKTDSIEEYLQNGSVPDDFPDSAYIALGYDLRPDFLTEVDAWRLSKMKFTGFEKFVRDTSQVSVLDKLFLDEKSLKKRRLNSNLGFDADELISVPFSENNKFEMQVDSLVREKGTVPVFRIYDGNPMKITRITPEFMAKDTLIIGSLDKPTTNGNWDN